MSSSKLWGKILDETSVNARLLASKMNLFYRFCYKKQSIFSFKDFRMKTCLPNFRGRYRISSSVFLSRRRFSDAISPEQVLIPYLQPSSQAMVDLKLLLQTELLKVCFQDSTLLPKSAIHCTNQVD